ncbi:MAG: thiamine-phosphate kinase [Pseudomonadota bacterium]|jgi:thiamine-monophosphate kinase
MPGEFDLIRDYFTRPSRHTLLGVGDDAALIAPAPGMTLAVSADMLVAGTHFFADTDPADLGWKTLAVNISDMAAMGAVPRWAFLSLALPAVDEAWIAAFAGGFFECAQTFDVDLAGGDTTRGPMNFSVTIMGEVPAGGGLLRSGAKPGDDIWISGTPGRAALGLRHLQGKLALAAPDVCLAALTRPQPRVALGLQLRGLARAAIDVSDGLLGDLAHILERSAVGAVVEDACLPLADLSRFTDDITAASECLLAGGDDYELLFCAPSQLREQIIALSSPALPLHRIGRITGEPGLHLLDPNGTPQPLARLGFDHFANSTTP